MERSAISLEMSAVAKNNSFYPIEKTVIGIGLLFYQLHLSLK
jgi:hypothetical protein